MQDKQAVARARQRLASSRNIPTGRLYDRHVLVLHHAGRREVTVMDK